MIELPSDFPHTAPDNYSYEVKSFRRNMVAIWLRHHYTYTYSTNVVRTIWGFYDNKKRCYFAPINAKKCGNQVNVEDTTPYSSMKVNRNPLMSAFL